MTEQTQIVLNTVVQHLSTMRELVESAVESGELEDVSGIYKLQAAIVQQSLITAAMCLKTVLVLESNKESPGPPQIVGHSVERLPFSEGHLLVAPNGIGFSAEAPKPPCDMCLMFPDPALGEPVRLCPCGRKLKRNRR